MQLALSLYVCDFMYFLRSKSQYSKHRYSLLSLGM
tara:strand:+ start:1742 stop:1846 length:105 start_codon:yes stop_codon:yes gene_type:complete